MSRPMNLWFVFCAVVLVVAACGEDTTPTGPSTNTTPTTVTDTFTGSINRNGAATHAFVASAAGTVSATLTSLGPNEEIVVGFGLGTWNGTVCTVVLARDQAVKTTVIYGNVNGSGELCVRVYDVGNVTEPTSYEITVVHP